MSNIQISVWIAVLPVTVFIYMNLYVLKLDTIEEYHYFKKQNGISTLLCMRLFSYFITCIYVAILSFNFAEFQKA